MFLEDLGLLKSSIEANKISTKWINQKTSAEWRVFARLFGSNLSSLPFAR